MMSCVRIFTNLRDRRDFMNEVEPAPITVVLRENLP
jgi:LacI family transcriptional regulator